jgi:hypothetical protein
LQKTNLQKDNPFEEIGVQVQKNELFEVMMLYNKDTFLSGMTANRTKDTNAYGKIKQNMYHFP